MSKKQKQNQEAVSQEAAPSQVSIETETPEPTPEVKTEAPAAKTGVQVVNGRKVRITVRNAQGDTQVEYLD